MIENDFAWIHSMKNFAWSHMFINIHETMMIDVLHQLFKRIILYLMLWLNQIINENVCTSQRRKEIRLALNDASETAQLNQRFHVILSFKDMKRFVKYSMIKQWIDADWKSIVYQFISVIASFLITRAFAAIHFAWAVIEFVILAQYHLHDEEILQYLEHTFFQLNKLKNVFHHLRSEHSDTDVNHFNISKLHAMTHYASQIQRYNNVDNFNIKHSEIAYKHLIKIFFNCINKWETFQRQLLHHNTRHLNLLAMKDILLYRDTRQSKINKHALTAMITWFNHVFNLHKIQDVFICEQCNQIQETELNSKLWCYALILVKILNIKKLLDVLTVFMCKCCNIVDEKVVSDRELNKKKKDSIWVRSYYVSVHESLQCWKWDEKNVDDLENLVSDKVYCSLNWQRKKKVWRCDYVLIQKRLKEVTEVSTLLNNRLSDQLRLILFIIDLLHQNNKSNELQHNDVLDKLLKSCNEKTQHAMHEMIEIEHWFKNNVKNSRFFKASQYFHLHTILKSVHVVSANNISNKSNKNKFFYINNFSDWNSYNSIYEKNFLHKETRVAKYYFKHESWKYLKLTQSYRRQKSNNVYLLCLCFKAYTESSKSTMLHD